MSKQKTSDLSPQRRALLEKRLRWRKTSSSNAQTIQPRDDKSSPAPMSFGQQRLWFLNQMEPNSSFYNLPFVIPLKTALNVAALERSINDIVARHEALRTTFTVENNQPRQVVSPTLSIPLPVEDLSSLSIQARQVQAQQLTTEEASAPFDLSQGPLLRTKLLKLEAADYVLLVTMHHIVGDGWSLNVLFREIVELYKANISGRPSSLPPLPVQYPDYAIWQRDWLRGRVLQEQLDYWKEKLAELPALQLPTDFPRPAALSYEGDMLDVSLPRDVTDGLKVLSQRAGATMYMTLVAAFNVLLFRYCRQEDIVIGSPVAGRNCVELEGLIGFFVNTLVLRTDMSGNPSFRDLLQRVKKVVFDAMAHQDVPFEKLVEELQPERDLARNPLFQVAFQLRMMPESAKGKTNESSRPPLALEKGASPFDLAFHFQEYPDGISGVIEYSTELFSAETVARIARNYETLLGGIIANPDQSIGVLPLMSSAERDKTIVEWNNTRSEYPRDAAIHRIFESQVDRMADSVIIQDGPRQFTYQEINERANQLAHLLRELGVGTEDLVGVCLDRSEKMVVAMLAILKAGGAYVPLDSTYPSERLAFMVSDAQTPVVITEGSQVERAVYGSNGHATERGTASPVNGAANTPTPTLIYLDLDAARIAQQNKSNLSCSVSGANSAYVMYTSGSTGTPKGIGIVHRAISRLVLNTNYVDLGPSDAIAQIANSSFDAATFEIWGSLLTGARLVIFHRDLTLSSRDFVDELRRQRITTMFITTALFNQLVQERESPFRGLRQVMFGGERCEPKYVRKVLSEEPPQRLLHVYGPTETTTFASWHRIGEVAEDAHSVPIGGPIGNTESYVLDRHLNPVPIGVPGELYVGGDGLARGYWRRPGLTAEKFVPNPFGNEAGARLYCTGDLVCCTAEGAIDFLGRDDDQVKVHGFRIELGEIEAALAEHAGVQDTVVLTREDAPGDRRLVAYVVQNPEYQGDEEGSQGRWEDQQVDHWLDLYEDLYEDSSPEHGETFNIVGWNSSYTGKPIPAEHMRVWVESTVERIMSLRPRRVLEIGCGTGLLLLRIAPHCEHYVATDFSTQSLEYVRRQLDAMESELPLTLMEKVATDFSDIEPRSFDVVVLSSIVQYFPNVEYLLEVLRGAVRSLRPGGSIFVGDVRSLPLLEAFHASVELSQAEDHVPLDQLRQRVQQQMAKENELALSPEFFAGLCESLPEVSAVEVALKAGPFDNELTRFRYDVVLHVGTEQEPTAPDQWLDWDRSGLTLEKLRKLLEEKQPELLGLRGVPNRRVARDMYTLRCLSHPNGLETVGDLRRRLDDEGIRGEDPIDFWSLAEEFRSHALIGCSQSRAGEGCYDVVFWRNGAASRCIGLPLPASAAAKAIRQLANNPLQGLFVEKLVPQLRCHLQTRLPEYMIPSYFVLLDRLPLTPNGKVDRRSLPQPDTTHFDETTYAPPQTDTQKKLADIWVDVLGVDRVGQDDSFFDLGGHSLMAMRLISRIRETFDTDLPVRSIFESPRLLDLASALDRQLTRVDSAAQQRIPRRKLDVPVPLSFTQERLWILNEMQPGTALYNMANIVPFKTALNISALHRSINEIIARHESLRTTFAADDGQPVQVIAPSLFIPLPVDDLSSLPEDARLTEARRLAIEEALAPFDLSRGPLVRTKMLKLGDSDYVLLLTTHHIISDGWSQHVFWKEVITLYKAFCTGRPSPLPELPIQYADFAVWIRNRLSDEVLAKLLSYWRSKLADLPVLELPTDHPRPPIQTFNGSTLSLTLDEELSASLNELSRVANSTLFMTLLAAFNVLLSRYSGQYDVVVGAPIAGRNRAETEGLIGFFLNTVVLRTDLSGNPSFLTVLDRVRETTLGAFAHQELPFEKLVDGLQPQRDLSRTPLFQVFFNMLNLSEQKTNVPANAITAGDAFANQQAKFDITVYVKEQNEQISFHFVYNSDLFEATTMARMSELFEALLRGIVADPSLPLSGISMLTEEDRSECSVGDSPVRPAESFIEFPKDQIEQSIAARFEAQVEKYPNNIAVSLNDDEWTYKQLNQAANRLARTILAQHGRGDQRIALLCSHDATMLAGILGVLKAGMTYVPLDPSYPEERNSHILNDSQTAGVVTRGPHVALGKRLSNGELPLIDIDAIDPQTRSENLDLEISADVLAYVLYTSGSTGLPKGIMQNHRNVLHHIRAYSNGLCLGPSDRLTLLSSYTFDAAIMDIFGALLNGASLFPMNIKDDGIDAILQRLNTSKITIYHSTPSVYRCIVGALAQSETLPKIRVVVLGGEAAYKRDFDLYRQHFPQDCRLVNGLGPTESTMCLQYWMDHETELPRNSLPVGRPVQDTEVLLLDAFGRPTDVYGEIAIRSPHIALGYWQNPRLSAESFLPDPEGGPGPIYRMGDMGRRLPDGHLEFVGRKDTQVKIRGYRVEAGEIERKLLEVAGITAAVVVTREQASAETQLVAYIVSNNESDALPRQLRRQLSQKLPDYMIPATFVTLDALPLTPTGKVDFRALPAPQSGRRGSEDMYVAPRTPVEEKLCQLWSELLGVEQVSILDNFFELGGHSLLAIQLVSRVRKTLEIDLSVRTVFETPTLSSLADAIERNGQRSAVPEIKRVSREKYRA